MGAIGLEPTMPVKAGGLQPPEQPIAQYTPVIIVNILISNVGNSYSIRHTPKSNNRSINTHSRNIY